MLVGIDSEVTITSMLLLPDPDVESVMTMQFTYLIDVYGRMDQAFNTDLNAAISNKIELVLNETLGG